MKTNTINAQITNTRNSIAKHQEMLNTDKVTYFKGKGAALYEVKATISQRIAELTAKKDTYVANGKDKKAKEITKVIDELTKILG